MTSDSDSFEALLNASEKKPVRRLSPGQKTTATIVGVDGETIFLDVGLKSEGSFRVISRSPAIESEIPNLAMSRGRMGAKNAE